MHLTFNGLGQSRGQVNVNIYMPGAQHMDMTKAVAAAAKEDPPAPRARAETARKDDASAMAKELQEQDRKISELLEEEQRREHRDQLAASLQHTAAMLAQ
eukprot:166046-Rhodomonas_salina.1